MINDSFIQLFRILDIFISHKRQKSLSLLVKFYMNSKFKLNFLNAALFTTIFSGNHIKSGFSLKYKYCNVLKNKI